MNVVIFNKATLHHGKSEDVLKSFQDNSIDTVIQDPPAAISFMGANWDSNKGGRVQWVDWMVGIQKEVLRVLKPGGLALTWALPRTSHWTMCALEDAGFALVDVVHHIHGQGFPKGADLSKALDKHLGCQREVVGRGHAGESSLERVRRVQQGYRPNLTSCTPESYPITTSATKEAKLWDGWHSQLKPAVENWIVAMKPLEGTFAENALQWGVAGFNIDHCRIGTEERPLIEADRGRGRLTGNVFSGGLDGSLVGSKHNGTTFQGRYPPNLVFSHHPECRCVGTKKVHSSKLNQVIHRSQSKSESIGVQTDSFCTGYTDQDGLETIQDWQCHPDCPVFLVNEQAGQRQSGGAPKQRLSAKTKNVLGKFASNCPPGRQANSGPVSRFFPCFYCPKASKSERGSYNNHFTVKPQALLRWLCTLTATPTGGVILDPFMGSGSTGLAALATGRKFIGIEENEPYFQIACRRMQEVNQETEPPLLDPVGEQLSLFDISEDPQ